MGVELTVREAGVEDCERWNHFVLTAGAPHHSYLYNWSTIIKRSLNQQPHYLLAGDRQGRIVGVLPLVHFRSRLFGDSLTSVPLLNAGGILAVTSDAEIALRDRGLNLSRDLGTAYVELRNINAANTLDDTFNLSTHKVSYELPLTEPDELLSSFSKKLRAQIKRPQKSGYTVKFSSGGNDAERSLTDFYRVFSRNMRDLGTPVYSRKLLSTILEELRELTTLVIVYGKRGPAACGLLVGYGHRTEILLASSVRDYNADAPNMLLYWEAMKWAYEQGYRIFDFGRSNPDSGPARFKEQWGAVKRSLHWYYYPKDKGSSSVTSGEEGSFGVAVRIWKRLPVSIANIVGPIISRQIP
jgi:FemAB-related protein (PEP-CTERM system-associated)